MNKQQQQTNLADTKSNISHQVMSSAQVTPQGLSDRLTLVTKDIGTIQRTHNKVLF
jgi:hypothetical protein